MTDGEDDRNEKDSEPEGELTYERDGIYQRNSEPEREGTEDEDDRNEKARS